MIAASFPDPSVVRVGGVYWAAATASSQAPLFPLRRSSDLVHWEPAGAVLPRRPRWASGSLWAPEIVVDDAGTRIYYAARRRGHRLCVAVAIAPAPQGPYADRGPLICQAAGSIDPAMVRDPAGRPYLLWKEDGNAVRRPTRIWVQRLRRNGLALVGARHAILRNRDRWEGAVVEGPDVVAHGGWLYLFYSGNAYGPPHCRYALGVARSRSLLGPWKRDPANPILRSNAAWRCPGHASIIDDDAGHTFALYHAYRAARKLVGPRLGLLDRVDWGDDGWPSINSGTGPSSSSLVP